jgi:hypothetical protein
VTLGGSLGTHCRFLYGHCLAMVEKAFQQYLGFSWSVNGEIKYYVFTVLPFGLSSAPFLFTKLMREIVKYWGSLSYPIIVYLDDGWCCINPENCYKISNSIRQDLKIAGFVVNEEKSVWEPKPSQQVLSIIGRCKFRVIIWHPFPSTKDIEII